MRECRPVGTVPGGWQEPLLAKRPLTTLQEKVECAERMFAMLC
jgi:hypothetical protein